MQGIDFNLVSDYIQVNLGFEPDCMLLTDLKKGVVTEAVLDAVRSALATGGPNSGTPGRKLTARAQAEAFLREYGSFESFRKH